jgi:hypothetical protein
MDSLFCAFQADAEEDGSVFKELGACKPTALTREEARPGASRPQHRRFVWARGHTAHSSCCVESGRARTYAS